MFWAKTLFALIAVVCWACSSPIFAAAPANDGFDMALTATESLLGLNVTNTAISNNEATLEAGEPIPDGFSSASYQSTVWYRWTNPSSTDVFEVSTAGSDFNTVLAVWVARTPSSPAVNDLQLLHVNDESAAGTTSRMRFTAVGDTTYYFSVASRSSAAHGNVHITVGLAFNRLITSFDGISFSPSTPDVSTAAVNVTTTLTMATSSDVNSGTLRIFGPDRSLVTSTSVSLSNRTNASNTPGTYQVSFTLPAHAAPGAYYWSLNATDSTTLRLGAIGWEQLEPIPAAVTSSFTVSNSNPSLSATTNAATLVNATSARLNGAANPAGEATTASFAYSTDSSLATGVTHTAGQSLGSGHGDVAFTADLAGLIPSTTYFYRAEASNNSGSVQGSILSFSTPSNDATLSALSTSGVTLSPAFDPATLSYSGTVINSVTSIMITPTVNESHATVKVNGVSVTSGSASSALSLNQGVNAFTVEVTAQNGTKKSYLVGVTRLGVVNAVFSSASTIPVTAASYTATGNSLNVSLNYSPTVGTNLMVVKNTGTAAIQGAFDNLAQGQVVAATFKGVEFKMQANYSGGTGNDLVLVVQQPVLVTAPASIPLAIVGAPFSIAIPATNAPVTYTVTNMPAGLSINQATGVISGKPTTGKLYHVSVLARTASGVTQTVVFDINVQALPDGVLGAFDGITIPTTGGYHSRINLTTLANATFSGKIFTAATAVSIAGSLITDPLDPNHPRLVVSLPPPDFNTLSVVLDGGFDAGNNSFAGTITSSLVGGGTVVENVSAWRNAWKATAPKATSYKILHTFSLEQADSGTAFPQGYGYGSFTPVETTGAVVVTGKLADGSSFSTTTFVGQQGQVILYQALSYSSIYSLKGLFAGKFTITTNGTAKANTLTGSASWIKLPPAITSTDTVYRDGFRVTLGVDGGAYSLDAGTVVMGLPNVDLNAKLDFTAGGLSLSEEPDITFSIRATTGSTVQKVAIPQYNAAAVPMNPNPMKVALSSITPNSGAFSGSFTIPGATAALNRSVTYQGMIVKHSDSSIRGYGYFLMPSLPTSGQTLSTSPKLSGRVVLKASS